MELSNTYSKKRAGFDVRYWITLALLIILAVAVVGFKKRFLFSCPAHTIPAEGIYTQNPLVKESFLINEPIVFQAPDMPYKTTTWFVDGQLKAKEGKLTHAFPAAGKYVVKLVLDDQCTYTKIVNILPYKHQTVDIKSGNSIALPDVVIEGNETFEAGMITYFTTPVIANAYEWQIVEMPEYGIKSEQLVGYSIISPGTYTLQLKLNNDEQKVFTKIIKVTAPVVIASPEEEGDMEVPRPIELPPPVATGRNETGGVSEASGTGASEVKKPKAVLPDSEILALLRLIREDKKTLGDLAASLCYGEKTKILANDNEVMTLAELTEKLQSKSWALGKRPKVNSVRTMREESDENCISVIYVNYK